MRKTDGTESVEVPNAVRAFVNGLPNTVRPNVKVDLDGATWRVELPNMTPRADVGDLLVSGLDVALIVDLTGRAYGENDLTIANVPLDCTLRVKVARRERGELRLQGLEGQLDLEGVEQEMVLSVDESCTGLLHLMSGQFAMKSATEVPVVLRLSDDSRLSLRGTARKMEVHGDCALETSPNDKIQSLVIDRQATITVHGRSLNARSVGAREAEAKLTMAWRGNQSSNDRRLNVSTINGIALDGRGTKLTVRDKAHRLGMAEGTEIVLPEWETVTHLSSSGGATLTAGRGAVVTNLSGAWKLGKVAEAHLHSGADDFGIETVQDAAGAVITGFRLSDPKERRRALDKLQNAHHLDPSVKNLPGSGSAYNTRVLRRADLNAEQQETLPSDTEFVRELGGPRQGRTWLDSYTNCLVCLSAAAAVRTGMGTPSAGRLPAPRIRRAARTGVPDVDTPGGAERATGRGRDTWAVH